MQQPDPYLSNSISPNDKRQDFASASFSERALSQPEPGILAKTALEWVSTHFPDVPVETVHRMSAIGAAALTRFHSKMTEINASYSSADLSVDAPSVLADVLAEFQMTAFPEVVRAANDPFLLPEVDLSQVRAPSLSPAQESCFQFVATRNFREPNRFRFAMLADLHSGPPPGYSLGQERKLNQFSKAFLAAFVDEANSTIFPDAIVDLGDLVEDSADEKTIIREFRTSLDVLSKAFAPVLHVMGNHEAAKLTSQEFSEYTSKPSSYYVTEFPSAICIVLNSNHPERPHGIPSIDENQLSWLSAVLGEATKDCVVFTHHPLSEMKLDNNPWFSKAPQICLVENREQVRAVLAASPRVRAVFCGHAHLSDIVMHDDIPYITLPSPVERYEVSDEPSRGFAVVDLTEQEVQVRIFGVVKRKFVHTRGAIH